MTLEGIDYAKCTDIFERYINGIIQTRNIKDNLKYHSCTNRSFHENDDPTLCNRILNIATDEYIQRLDDITDQYSACVNSFERLDIHE